MRLILIRHGETLWNENHKFQGISDIELSPRGVSQAKKLAESLRSQPIVKIYSSPLIRARQTAEEIARYHDCQVIVVRDLRELNQGRLEGLTVGDLHRDFPDFLKNWIENPEFARLPDGESLEEVQCRAWAVIMRMTEEHSEETVAVVAHSFVNLTILCRILEMPLKHFRKMRQEAAAINFIEFTEKGAILRGLNDTCHLSRF
jgi:broad specificity phosphatase PhoE